MNRLIVIVKSKNMLTCQSTNASLSLAEFVTPPFCQSIDNYGFYYKTIFLSLILTFGAVFIAAGDLNANTRIEQSVFDFFEAHFIGNTLIHQHYIPMDNGTGETEVTHRRTYTNLTNSENALSFDVFAVRTHTDYELDPDGKRRNETRAVSERNVSLTRYTVHSMANTQRLSGISRCLSHTETELIGTTATIELWFNADTLKLMSYTPVPLESDDGGEDLHSVVHISVQDFWVEEQQLRSRLLSRHYSLDTTTLAVTPQALDVVPSLWRAERNRTHFHQITDPIQEREDHLIERMKKSGDDTTFLVMREGYLHPCKIVGAILESFPLQANVQMPHDNSQFRTVFYKLLLLSEVDVSVYTMEIFNGTQWKPTISFQWDGDSFLGKMEAEPESKKHTLNQVRFKK